jgi:hypothetical protein
MNKRLLTYLSFIYTGLVIVGFFIYGYSIQEDGMIDPKEHSTGIFIFIVLGVIALILAGIDAAGVRDNSKRVSRKAIYAGLSIAVFFLMWRILLSIY